MKSVEHIRRNEVTRPETEVRTMLSMFILFLHYLLIWD